MSRAKSTSSNSNRSKKTKDNDPVDDMSVEEAQEAMKRLKSKIDKAKKTGKLNKKAAGQRAEAEAERQYQEQQKQTTSSPAPTTPKNRADQQKKNHPRQPQAAKTSSGRSREDDAYAIRFDEADDDLVEETRRQMYEGEPDSSPVVSERQKRKNDARSDAGDDTGDERSAAAGNAAVPTKKLRGAGAATVRVGAASQPLRKTLPGRKGAPKVPKKVTKIHDTSSEESSDEDRHIGEHTPYNRVLNPGDKNKPKLEDLSPTSVKIAKSIRTEYGMLICTLNAFPDDEAGNEMVDGLFLEETNDAVEGSKLARRTERYAADDEYQTDIHNLGKNVGAGFRGRVAATAQPLVDDKYDFEKDDMTVAKRKERAVTLVKQGAFAHRDWKNRKGYLQNPLIWRLLAKHFLARRGTKGKPLVEPGPHMSMFKEMPNELIAFLLTTIHCAIDGWSDGTFKKAEFSQTEYETKYKAHLSTIKTVADGNAAYMTKVRELIWDEACKLANISPSITVQEDVQGEIYLTAEELEGLGDE